MTTAIEKSGAFGADGSFELAQREARAFCSSDLVPAQYRGNVPNTLIAMNVARRLNADILGVMSHLYVVHGRPAFDSTFLIATVNSSGRFSPLRFRFQGAEGQPSWGCRAVATDKDTGEECLGSLITMALAEAEGWIGKKGSKWVTMPEHMLKFRAAAFWTREYAPELSLGMQTVDEVRDVGDAWVVEDKPQKTAMETLKKKLTNGDNGDNIEPVVIEPVVVPENAFNVFEEIETTARELWGDDYQSDLADLTKSHGFNSAKLNKKQAGDLLDLLIEKISEDQEDKTQ